MFKLRVLPLFFLFPVLLAACASTYPVQFSPLQGQEVQQRQEAGGAESWLVSQKTHRVELASAFAAQPVHQPLRLKLRVRNGGKTPVQFGPEQVRASLQGAPVAVLSQEALVQAAQDRVQDAQRSQGFEVGNARVLPSIAAGVGGGSGVSVFAGVGINTSGAGPDLERAKADLQRVRQQGLNARQLNPGEWAEGEVELDAQLGSWQQGSGLVLEVLVGGEAHTLRLAYRKAGRAG